MTNLNSSRNNTVVITRIKTGAILLILVAFVIFLGVCAIPAWTPINNETWSRAAAISFFVCVNLVALWATWELGQLHDKKNYPLQVLFLATTEMLILWGAPDYFETLPAWNPDQMVGLANFASNLKISLLPLTIVLFAWAALYLTNSEITFNTIAFYFFMTILLAFSFRIIILIMLTIGWVLPVAGIIMIVMNDTFGYFGGMIWGKKPLAPQISPKKTVEGAITGITFAVITTYLFLLGMFFSKNNIQEIYGFDLDFSKVWVHFVLIILLFLISIITIAGDLFFSKIKRHYKIKDFGTIFPGHGGLMDRLDSFTFGFLAIGLIILAVSLF